MGEGEGESEDECEGEGESEDECENQGDTDPLRHRHILIHTRIPTHPPQKYHHSTQDQILHPAQPSRQPAQFYERIPARITVKIFLKNRGFSP